MTVFAFCCNKLEGIGGTLYHCVLVGVGGGGCVKVLGNHIESTNLILQDCNIHEMNRFF